MEIASGKWFSPQLEMEDPTLFPPYQMMMNPIEYPFHNDHTNYQSFSSNPYINDNSLVQTSPDHEVADDFKIRPLKQLKTNSWNSSSSSSSQIISFDNSNYSSPAPAVSQQHYYGVQVEPKNDELGHYWDGNLEYFPSLISQTACKDQYCSTKSGQRTPLHAQDHVIAERKRREKLSQSFISLSALIPGLKKTDKASILGDAIKYLKQLQERVNVLEQQVAKRTMESVIFVRKTLIYADDDDTSSSDESFSNSQSNKHFPEIEARVSDKDVLIRIHCKNNKGCISKLIYEVEKLHLFVVSSHVLPFGQTTLDITIAAQMETEFSMTVKDLVKSLRLALLKFIP